MGTCVSNNARGGRKVDINAKVKIVYLKSIKVAKTCRLDLSKQQSIENFSKTPKMDINQSELYNRRMNQRLKKSQVHSTS